MSRHALLPPRRPCPASTTRAMVDLGALATMLVARVGRPGGSALGDARGRRRWASRAHRSRAGGRHPRRRASPACPRPAPREFPLARAPRRLLAWPAFAFATAALWFGLWTAPDVASLTVEAYAIPPAVGLLAFAALLVWLRRHGEAAVAVDRLVPARPGGARPRGLVGLPAPRHGRRDRRGRTRACCSTCTPALRARIPALAGATTALARRSRSSRRRAGVDDPLDQVAWLLLLLGVAYVVRDRCRTSRCRRRDGRALWRDHHPAFGRRDRHRRRHPRPRTAPPVLTVALVVLGGPPPRGSGASVATPFGAATRWTTIGAAAAFAVAGFLGGAATIDGVAGGRAREPSDRADRARRIGCWRSGVATATD